MQLSANGSRKIIGIYRRYLAGHSILAGQPPAKHDALREQNMTSGEDRLKKGRFVESIRARLDWFSGTILPHEAALRARLGRIMPRRDDLDDLVAEAMARAYAAPDFASVLDGKPYLFRIARNIVLDEVRRDRVVSFELLADFDYIATDTSTEAALEARDELRRLEAIIETLPIQCRRAFLLRRVHDKSVPEIAEEMGLSVSTVDKHIGRAATKVMQALGEFEGFGFGRSLQRRRGTTGDRRGSRSSLP